MAGIWEATWDATRDMAEAVAAPFQEPSLRLGVTGLSRAGKTVFITSLVANLMDRGRMPQLRAAAEGRILAAWLQPQPDDAVARFAFEEHLAALTAPEPRWPEGTRRVAELRLSLRLAPRGWTLGMGGPRVLHFDIVDYPGEWLLDLALMGQDFAGWSADALERARGWPGSEAFLRAVAAVDGAAQAEEPTLKGLAEAYSEAMARAREAGFSYLAPGRFLLPGDLEGSPALTFAPLPPAADPGRRSLWRECERRFESYKRLVVGPFFRDHFRRIDRQAVLVDALGAAARGEAQLRDLRDAMAALLRAFNPGGSAWLARWLGQRRVERVLLAATKADHLHHSQHARLAALAEAILREARDRAAFAGARTEAMAIASLRTTVEDRMEHKGETLDVVKGRVGGRVVAVHAGGLPEDPLSLLAPGGGVALRAEAFEPAPLTLRPGEGPPHIRLDKAAEFLFGDRL